jgi:predicted NBD/HSP70 family sugar kinase
LRSRGVFAATLTLRIRFADGRVDSRTTRLPEPAASDDALLETAAALLARVTSGERPIRAIGISCAGPIAAGPIPALFAFRRPQQNR